MQLVYFIGENQNGFSCLVINREILQLFLAVLQTIRFDGIFPLSFEFTSKMKIETQSKERNPFDTSGKQSSKFQIKHKSSKN